MKLAKPFIRLPWSFDAKRLADEVNQFDDSCWMPHPSGMAGNSAVPLISRGAGDNNDFDGAMAPTPHLQRCEYIQQVMAHIDEVYGRSRLMKLAPDCEVSQHVDFNYHWYTRVRIHVPVITTPDVVFYCGDQALNMRAGECWIFDSWRHHRVVNNGTADRTHLVIDTAGSSRFWNTVRRMQQFDVDEDTEALRDLITHVPYTAGAASEVRTERFNSAPVMAPGEMAALVGDLLEDLRQNPANDPQRMLDYEILLTNLAIDWREIWHLHGYQKSGWPIFKNLLDGTVAKLDPNPRVLTTASNDVGVNPIVMQRILRAALRVDQMSDFVGTI